MTDEEFLAEVQRRCPKQVHIGKVSGQVRLYGPAWDYLREVVWQRERGLCQVNRKPVTLTKGQWHSMHAAHIHSKGAGGSDLPSNIRCLSLAAHGREHAGDRSAYPPERRFAG